MSTALTLLCLSIFAQLTPIDEPFLSSTLPPTFHLSLGTNTSFARIEPRTTAAHCLHLFGDHSATSVSTDPVPDIAYTLDYDFFQPAKEVGGYQAVVRHDRPEGSSYWWLEYGPDRFFVYAISGGHWSNRWEASAPSDRWLHVRIVNSPRIVKITVSDDAGHVLAQSPPISHDDGTPAPIVFSAVGEDRGNWGMKIASVHLAVTPVADRADFQHRRASLDATRAALASPDSRNLWPTGDEALAPVQLLLDAVASTDPASWDAYVKNSAAFDSALTSLAAKYRASVLDKLDRKRGDWTMLDLAPSFDADAALQNIAAPAGPVAEVSGVPFQVLGFGPNCVFQDQAGRGRRSIPLKAEARSLALLLAPVYDQTLYASDDSLIDVLGIELRYADGFRERIFPTPAGWTPPLAAGIGRPPMEEGRAAAYLVEPGHSAPLTEVTLCDDAIQAGWALLGLSYKSGRPTELPTLRPERQTPMPSGAATLTLDPHRGLLTAFSDPLTGPIISPRKPSPIFAVQIGDRLVYSDDFVVTRTSNSPGKIIYDLRGPGADGPLTVEITVTGTRDMTWRAKMTNASAAPISARLIFPLLDGLDLGPEPVWWFPQRGGASSDVPFEALASYGGMAWMQLLDVTRAGGGGLYMRCDDPTGVYKIFALRSSPDDATQPARVCDLPEPAHPVNPWRAMSGVHLSIQYLPVTLAPGASFSPPSATVAFHRGDWHVALADYAIWLHTWWHQVRPCPDTYRYGFWALVGGVPTDSQRNEDCGGADWWHLSPVWSVDYPDDLAAELAMLKTQAVRAAKWDERIGLYLEGFVMEKKRRIAREHGAEWAMMDDHGKLYDYYSSEGDPVFDLCPAVPAWQKFDAAAYAEIARRYSLAALYVDSTGSRWSEVCYNPAHAHPTPGIWAQGCGALFEALRQAVMKTSPTTAIHSEEPGSDYMALHEDGSWSHSLWSAISGDPTFNPSGLNFFRFVLPEFKMYEIPSYRHALWRCKLAFFNGEGLWTDQPDALRRDLFRQWMPTLRENADTFQSATVAPATTQVSPPLYMNAFTRGGQTIYTIYNAGLRTRRAEIHFGAVRRQHVFDLLRLEEVHVKALYFASGVVIIGTGSMGWSADVSLDPHEVQCYLVTPRLMTAEITDNTLRVSFPNGLSGGKLWLALVDGEGVRHNAQFVDGTTIDLTKLFGPDAHGRILLRLATPHATLDETIVPWR